MEQMQALLQTDDPFDGLGDFEIAPDVAELARLRWGGRLSYQQDDISPAALWVWDLVI